MPKQKTHKGLSKRVKVTGTGKVKRKRCNGGHLMSGKSAKRCRRIRSDALVVGKKAQLIKTALGL
jgi:large subunit ribosomal protein L35